MSKRRVVVTGMGILCPTGNDVDTFWDNITNGRSGIGYISHFDATEFKARIAGELKDFEPTDYIDKKEVRRMDPFCVYGVVAARQAVQHSGLDMNAEDASRVGVVVGSGIGGLQILQDQWTKFMEKGPSRFSPFMIPQMITNMISGLIAIEHGMNGPNFCVTSACATAAHSIGESLRMIQHNEADVMVVGGTEAPVCELGIGGFCAMKALSFSGNESPTTASRPFDAGRDGFVCAEGAGVLVIEELEHAKARGATIYAELSGYGRTCDANHITAPLEGGEGAAAAMKNAYTDAGLSADQIQYINAHGTSTPLNDKAETKAIKVALGEDNARKLKVSSTKSMTGHLLGAAAAVESIAAIQALRNGIVPPTINQENSDPDCDLDYVPNAAQEWEVKACLNNSLGFGGHNASLCFTRFDG